MLLNWCINIYIYIYLDHIDYFVSSVILMYGTSTITSLCWFILFGVFFVLFFLLYSDFLYVCILLECCTYCIYWTLWSVTSSYYKWELMFYCFSVPIWNKIFLLLLYLIRDMPNPIKLLMWTEIRSIAEQDPIQWQKTLCRNHKF